MRGSVEVVEEKKERWVEEKKERRVEEGVFGWEGKEVGERKWNIKRRKCLWR